MDDEILNKILEEIKVSQKEIKKLLEMTFEIPHFNEGWGAHYPSECLKLLDTMEAIYVHQINKDINNKCS